jgi:paired amphipathic helix protein Sin3a
MNETKEKNDGAGDSPQPPVPSSSQQHPPVMTYPTMDDPTMMTTTTAAGMDVVQQPPVNVTAVTAMADDSMDIDDTFDAPIQVQAFVTHPLMQNDDNHNSHTTAEHRPQLTDDPVPSNHQSFAGIISVQAPHNQSSSTTIPNNSVAASVSSHAYVTPPVTDTTTNEGLTTTTDAHGATTAAAAAPLTANMTLQPPFLQGVVDEASMTSIAPPHHPITANLQQLQANATVQDGVRTVSDDISPTSTPETNRLHSAPIMMPSTGVETDSNQSQFATVASMLGGQDISNLSHPSTMMMTSSFFPQAQAMSSPLSPNNVLTELQTGNDSMSSSTIPAETTTNHYNSDTIMMTDTDQPTGAMHNGLDVLITNTEIGSKMLQKMTASSENMHASEASSSWQSSGVQNTNDMNSNPMNNVQVQPSDAVVTIPTGQQQLHTQQAITNQFLEGSRLFDSQHPSALIINPSSLPEQQHGPMSSYNDMEQQQQPGGLGMANNATTASLNGMSQPMQSYERSDSNNQQLLSLSGAPDRNPPSIGNYQGSQVPNNHNDSNATLLRMPQQDEPIQHGVLQPPQQSMSPPQHHTNHNNGASNNTAIIRNLPNRLYEHHNDENRPPSQIPQFNNVTSPGGSNNTNTMFGAMLSNGQPQLPMDNPVQGTPPGGGGGGMRELRVEDALLYLDDVKREFKDRPAIYNEFLSIMKNFKAQEVDTPGVIDRVSKLFRGYNTLILGFNTFLPDGCKISLADLERAEAQRLAEEQSAQLQAQIYAKVKKPKMQGVKRGPKPGPGALNAARSPPDGGVHHVVHSPPGYVPNGTVGQDNAMTSMQQGNDWGASSPDMTSPPRMQDQQQARSGSFGNQPMQPSPPQQHQAVEFDHAISYVTTIKKRFASDPNTYHSFLEILHTYQKEQRGIKEVLEQVAHLFQDHSDLLREFAFFLPDAVQEQAKERLHRAVAESESRVAAQRQQQLDQFTPRAGDARAIENPVSSDAKINRAAIDKQRASMQQPESFVYNSAVERQFFDSTRESLTSFSRDSGQAWAEFMKCLDMYSQEILSRSEMLNFVEPLLGKRNNNLFEEFKRILSAAGSPTLSTQQIDDAWYSVPLAEIDFGRCRRCSPSYRALPRDYPAPPCSERSEEESKVLNDVWVSLPVGSEESYTFRHMRRNAYEETLFRVEDERFEIDMVIDSNDATLQRLDPIAKEIAYLAQEDIVPTDLGVKPLVEGAGLGGKRYQYTFNKKILGVVHRNAIARIYGDNGQEMLDLLVRNPTVAVPLVVQRLRQKQTEWRTVRERLNKHWKDVAEHNYYKSLDHRSLTWRTTDKRAISARTLVAEIKDRAANGGRESKEAYRQKLDKAKEEHGTYFEVTVGTKLSYELDLTFLPKPDRRLFTPHLILNYKNVSWAQRDAYRILSFALERGTIAPADKERCHRLWVEFLGPWFALSFNWMQKPAVTYQESTAAVTESTSLRSPTMPSATIVSEDDEESLDEEPELLTHMVTEELSTNTDTNKRREYTDHHPLPAGALVSTLYGEGKIIEFRRTDHVYGVRLAFGAIGYLRPATVLCSMLPVEKSAYTRQLRSDDRTKLARPNDQLAFGTQNLYLFFRLHEILVQRLNTAKRLAYSVGDDRSLQSMVEQIPNANPKVVGRRRYEAYLSLIYSLLDGGVGGAAEGGKYEDRVRSMLGHQAYELATMDKLIAHIWKDIQTMANDETMWSLIQLYRRHVLAGSFQPEAFRQEAAYLSDGEAMYAFQHCYLSNNDESVLHVEYLGVMDDGDDVDNMDTAMEDDMVLEPQPPPAPAPPSQTPPPVMDAPASKRVKR